mgnify:CR=1 FL=1
MQQMNQQMTARPELRHGMIPTEIMQQSLHMLQMNYFELDQFIEENLETNPFLERVGARETSLSDMSERPLEDTWEADERLEQDYEQDVLGRSDSEASAEAKSEEWDGTERYREGANLARNPDLDDVWQYYQDSITQDESLSAHLLNQMRMAADTPQAYAIGERIIIGDIDERGYFTGNPAEIASELDVSEEEVRKVLDIIRQFEPAGIGAANLVECLLMQCELEYPGDLRIKELLKDHWAALATGRITQIAEAMNCTPEQVMELKGMVSRLDPYPGREYSVERPSYVVPEVVVETIEDDFVVTLAVDFSNAAIINEAYVKEIQSRKMDEKERSYVREHLDSARFLLYNIERRKQTLVKTAQAIVDLQRDFMGRGIAFMKPLTLEEVAVKVGVSASTISRTVNGKYIQTPQGLFELKYFFSSGLRSDNGGEQSSTAVCAQIKDIIEKEDKHHPLSDQKIADLLQSAGVHVARRTVTKYREQLGMLPAKMRRTY